MSNKGDPDVREMMADHYSQPKGFVGRQIIYRVLFAGVLYGAIAGGSATKNLPGRDTFYLAARPPLNTIVNNTFFHIRKIGDRYPTRNFTTSVVRAWRERIVWDWQSKYNDPVCGFETLVELPRLGELYLRDGWVETGVTRGMTCKRVGGKGSDSWSGRRVWDEENLRPKRVLMRLLMRLPI
jgi:hypothetical protein